MSGFLLDFDILAPDRLLACNLARAAEIDNRSGNKLWRTTPKGRVGAPDSNINLNEAAW